MASSKDRPKGANFPVNGSKTPTKVFEYAGGTNIIFSSGILLVIGGFSTGRIDFGPPFFKIVERDFVSLKTISPVDVEICDTRGA